MYLSDKFTQQDKANILFHYYHLKMSIPEISQLLKIDEKELLCLFITELYEIPFYYHETKTNSFFRYGPQK